jgi:hypothetical protein
MRRVRLVATDLDGTLLRRDGTVSDRARRALAAAQAAGLVVVLVTGRPPRFVRSVAAGIGLTGLVICCNGALVYDLGGETIAAHTPLAEAVARRIVARLRAAVPGVAFAVELGLRFGCEPAYADGRPASAEQAALIADALGLCREPVTKLIAFHRELTPAAMLPLVQHHVGGEAMATISGAPFVEIGAAGADKGRALAALCGRLGITAAEVVAFGDMPNDLTLLGWAGHSVAMANGHAEVLARAHEIAPSNEEDGVALVLERLAARRWQLGRAGGTPDARSGREGGASAGHE